jgi:hypothetical protein
MNKSLRRHEFGTKEAHGFPISLLVFENILHWLTGFFQLTEEERETAGIYLGDQYSSNTQSDKQPQ